MDKIAKSSWMRFVIPEWCELQKKKINLAYVVI